MRYFPLFFDMRHQSVIVAGGGEQALQKVRLLVRTEARVTVIAPTVVAELEELAGLGRMVWECRDARARDVDDADAVFVADVDEALARILSDVAQARGIPVNVVDRPDLSNAIMPALIDRDPLVVAIGTEGAAPVLAQGVKAKVEAMLPPRLGALARKAASLRDYVAETLPAGAARRTFWRRYFFGPVRDAFLAGEEAGFISAVENELDTVSRRAGIVLGRVALVGAGPGDPELLTLKAQRLLQEADVIVHDRLIGPDILDYARRDAGRIPVGKKAGGPSHRQEDINRILIEQALEGRLVVRLKGGDPYLFGRGSEEQEALEAYGIPVEVVPGITAALGCAASAKMPLTRRGTHRRLTLITAMAEDGPAEHDWDGLAAPGQTIAVYMGVNGAGRVARKLLDAGIDPATPVAVIENGTLPNELVVETNVARLAAGLEVYGIKGPAVIFIGAPAVDASRSDENTPRRGNVVPFPGGSRAAAEAWLKVLP